MLVWELCVDCLFRAEVGALFGSEICCFFLEARVGAHFGSCPVLALLGQFLVLVLGALVPFSGRNWCSFWERDLLLFFGSKSCSY